MHLLNAVADTVQRHAAFMRERRRRGEAGAVDFAYHMMAEAADRTAQPRCGRFELGDDVLTAARGVAASRGSSILQALHLARLPHPVTWLECLAPLEFVGSHQFSRLGWLLLEDGDQGFVGHPYALHPHRGPIWLKHSISLFYGEPQPLDYDGELLAQSRALKREITEAAEADRLRLYRNGLRASGYHVPDEETLRRSLREYLARPPEENVAATMLYQRVQVEVHDDVGRPVQVPVGSPELTAYRAQAMALVAMLLLMNSRNAVVVDDEPDLERLNRARQRKGNVPLRPLRPVTLDLSRRLRAARRAGDNADAHFLRAHLVRGHFKTRATGVFWWSAHPRGNVGRAAAQNYGVVGVPDGA